MALENLSEIELKEKFELFLFNLSNQLEDFLEKALNNGYKLDYSLDSLSVLEKFLIKEKVTVNDDFYSDASGYLGEVVRKNFDGIWECSLDKEKNGIHYGLPVIVGHSDFDIELSPFTVVKIFLIRHRENHFSKVIKNHTNPTPKDINF